ncbi:BatA and WFA domain-containing protein, partial [Candidatus Woesearchaeota archaeon]|nr:BatA and WFA domain-containing protein [Candidatus Woesearchaeota archaeon]
MEWGNTVGLYALASLVPFIILYLVRPRPKDLTVPSLMFLFRHPGTRHKSSFLRNFLKDMLFLMQLLVLLLLCFSIADPLIKVDQTVISKNTAIVIDVSASMGLSGVWTKALAEAKKSIGSRTSIILAENTPVSLLEGGSRGDALEILNGLKPKGTSTNLGDAIAVASETIEDGRVIVISDFLVTEGPDPIVAKNLAESKGLAVDFINVGKEEGNFAITDIRVGKVKSTIYFKNFYDTEQTVAIKIGTLEKTFDMAANSVEIISIATPPGLTKVEILNTDHMPEDNIGYISTPEDNRVRVLLITNNENAFLKSALTASPNVDLEVAIPPIVPDPNHDVVVFNDFDASKLLPGTFESITNYVRKGNNVIFTAQDNMPDTSLIPAIINGLNEESAEVVPKVINELTKDIEFGRVAKYFNATAAPNSVVLAKIKDSENDIVVVKELGAGKTVYYGIFEKDNDFKYSPSYPIFWNNLLFHLAFSQDLGDYNYKTGTILNLGTPTKVNTPSGYLTAQHIFMDEIGIYEFPDKKVAVNLINEKESNLQKSEEKYKSSQILEEFEKSKKKVDKSLISYLAIIALIIVL